MASNALAPFVYQIQEGLNQFDIRNWVQSGSVEKFFNTIDFKSFGWIAVAVVAIILVLDFFTKSAVPFGRSLTVSAADAWQRNRNILSLDKSGRSSRNLDVEPVIEVLDALAEAVKKWEGPQDFKFRSSDFQ